MTDPGGPTLSKTADWDSLSAGNVDGTDFAIAITSICIDNGVDLATKYVNALFTGTDFSTSPPTVVTTSQAPDWDIGAWVFESGGGEAPPEPGSMSFFWRCETEAFDDNLDYTADLSASGLSLIHI